MEVLMTAAAALTNLWALPAIYNAKKNNRCNSSVFLFLLMFYGIAHALSSTKYISLPLVAGESGARYMRADYILVLLFILFSDEFNSIGAIARENLLHIGLMMFSFILSDVVHFLDLTPQYYRFFQCIAQCAWRFIFYELVCLLQQHAYKLS